LIAGVNTIPLAYVTIMCLQILC